MSTLGRQQWQTLSVGLVQKGIAHKNCHKLCIKDWCWRFGRWKYLGDDSEEGKCFSYFKPQHKHVKTLLFSCLLSCFISDCLLSLECMWWLVLMFPSRRACGRWKAHITSCAAVRRWSLSSAVTRSSELSFTSTGVRFLWWGFSRTDLYDFENCSFLMLRQEGNEYTTLACATSHTHISDAAFSVQTTICIAHRCSINSFLFL